MPSLLNLALILTFFVLGYASRKSVPRPAALSLRLNRYVINLAFPAVILQVVPHLALQPETAFMVLAPWLVVICNALLLLWISRRLGWEPAVLCGALIMGALGNTGFLGFPLIQSFFTSEQLGAAIIYDQFGTFIGLCTYATILVALFSGRDKIAPGQIVKRILLFPPFVTLLVALLLPLQAVTQPLHWPLQLLGWSIVPCTMFSIGLQFSFRTEPELLRPLAFTLAMKMVLAPLLVLSAGLLLGIPEWLLDIAVFEAATPPMVTSAVILIAAGLSPRFASATLGFGTLIALAYLPLLALFLNST